MRVEQKGPTVPDNAVPALSIHVAAIACVLALAGCMPGATEQDRGVVVADIAEETEEE